jgi:hypothetical protein
VDSQRFDDITRSLATAVNRRAILQRFAAGLAGVGLTGISRGQSSAAPSDCAVFCADQPGARGAQCRQVCKKCADGPRATCFDDSTGSFTCLNVQGDADNCGSCRAKCAEPRTVCAGGSCVCPSGTVFIEATGICRSCTELLGRCATAGDCGTGGGDRACQNGCCCVPAGSLSLGCVPGTPVPNCCSGMCGSNGRCA